PNVPKSVIVPWSQEKACPKQLSGHPGSPGKVDWPRTCPLSFAHCAPAIVPPSVGMSVILPLSHKNACDSPKLVEDDPATSPTRWLLQPPEGNEPGPPSVPRSCITPFLQMNA